MGDPVALESRPLGRTIGAHCPRTETRVLYLVRRRLIKWRYFWPAVSRVSRAVLLRHPPMGAPASCATAPRTAGAHPRAQAKMPKEAPAAVTPCLRSPALPSSPTRGDAPRDRRPPNHAASAAFASAQRIEKLLARQDITLDCFKDLTLHRRAPTGQREARFIYCDTANGNRTIWPSESCRPSSVRVAPLWNG
jgi:hypothetical protein